MYVQFPPRGHFLPNPTPILKTDRRRWVELSQRIQTAVQIVSKPPSRFTVFGKPAMLSAGWFGLLLIKAGDVETNIPVRQTHTHKQVLICDICHKQIHVMKHIYIRCNRIEHCMHLRYTTLDPGPSLLPTPHIHPHTTTAQTQTHAQPSHVPTGLVKPKPNPLIHLQHTQKQYTHYSHSDHRIHIEYHVK